MSVVKVKKNGSAAPVRLSVRIQSNKHIIQLSSPSCNPQY